MPGPCTAARVARSCRDARIVGPDLRCGARALTPTDISPPAELIARLRRGGHLAADPAPVPLEGGRINRVWRLRGVLYDLVLKLYDPEGATPLFANDPLREAACLSALADSGLAPVPLTGDAQAERPWILYRHLPGKGWTEGVEAVACVLARVHDHAPLDELPTAPDGSAEITRQTLEILSLCRSADVEELRRCQPRGDVVASGLRRLVHGDPVPGNIVVQGGRAALIDWQCPALGDPAGDLAIFTSPAMQRIYRGTPLSAAENDAFLGAYPDPTTVERFHALRPWYHWRMAAYCLYQAERGRADYAEGLTLERAALPRHASARKSVRPIET
ncbi:aminoglycoside phosphotransferase family protein [Aquicoccus sp. SU-CL01552]|uniref:phosphotransferase family protein n=1 Tax=Aquicoccus sp. SU-CL01552 TaxID=3127656 RepID=UPI0031032DAF